MIQTRHARPEDAECIASIYRPFVCEGWTSFETDAPSADVIATRMSGADDIYPWLVVDEGEGVTAYAYASPHRTRAAYRSSVDTAIYCAPSARGKGVAKVLYSALIELLSKQNYIMAFAGIALPNPASLGLHRALGFHLIGTYSDVGFKAGAWRSTQWWARPLAEPKTPPAPILKLSEIC